MADGLSIPGYEIIELIGEGGMARVYKARQNSLGRLVAIKVLREDLVSDPFAIAQFHLEANAVANLKHQNILLVHEAGDIQNVPYFVMEYVPGFSVASWLERKGFLPESDALTIAESVATALNYAWERAGLVHCDVKPGNLLLDEGGVIKVADFSGISRTNIGKEADLLSRLTIGTPNYMSPEQVSGLSNIDCRVDIYAMGALLYHLVSGQVPFGDAANEHEAMSRQVDGTLEDPRRQGVEVSSGMVRLIEKLLIKDRDLRYADWKPVLKDIERVREGRIPAEPMPYPGTSTLARDPALEPKPRTATSVFAPFDPTKVQPVSPSATVELSKPPDRKARIRKLIFVAVGLVLFNILLVIGAVWSSKRNRPSPTPRPTPTAPHVTPPVMPPKPPQKPEVKGEPKPPPQKPTPKTEPKPEPKPVTPPEPKPPETVVEPGSETTEPAADERVEQVRSYLDLMQKVFVSCQRREFDDAQGSLQGWLHINEKHPLRQRVEADSARVGLLLKFQSALAEMSRGLVGKQVQFSGGQTGEIQAVQSDRVVLMRKFAAGTAQTTLEFSRMTDADLQQLCAMADPAVGLPLLVQRQLAAAQYPAAEALVSRTEQLRLPIAADLRAWLTEWRQVAANLRAEQLLSESRTLFAANKFADAAARLENLREAFGDTDVVKWLHAKEIEELTALIDEQMAPATEPAVSLPDGTNAPATTVAVTNKPPVAAVTNEPPAAAATNEPAVAGADVQQVKISELRGGLKGYDHKTVRIQFRTRSGSTEQKDNGRYACSIYMGSEGLAVEVDDEGRKWLFKNVPAYQGSWSSDGSERNVVAYGIVDAATDTVRLLGRTRKTRMGAQGSEFLLVITCPPRT